MRDGLDQLKHLDYGENIVKIEEIQEIQDIIRVGEITEGTRLYSGKKHVAYDRALTIDYDDSLPKGLVSKYLSIVYIFVVDGEVYKIGQTGGKGGLKTAINFYLKSGQDDPGLNRFTINYLIRESLEQGKCVELYFYYEDSEERLVKGLYGNTHKVESLVVPPKDLERLGLDDYKSDNGEYPLWNFQERSEKIRSDIHQKFSEYKGLRA